ncbi:unnamed protein product [Didymodactylos carnosus]|uniref:Major facilitator superfamily (MFS) profile domain-containing protein n=1 Tax=Didymodactylos carnosus TaxID=1234261 RepID=A0A814U2D2_9BILA|nr:unnamed protein product [Didymodactylos carnosus]CAF1168979.1 unnamed protein product [Didymodactylos carnosus]CAF3752694.1 unnamed protein product [Didymodactylos carnosus]CAF3932677.1 unnamed protein product [Didymodactylos carnosus]
MSINSLLNFKSLSPTSTSVYYLIHLNIMFYSFFFWFNQPVFPYLSQSLGASDVQISYLNSFNQLMQLLGTFLIGRIIDVRGARTALLISHFFSTISYVLLYYANSVELLFLSKLPTFLMSAMHSSQAYVAYLSDENDRAKALGRLSLSYGIGFIVGPFLGGMCSKHIGYSNIALVAAVGEFLVVLILFISLPNFTVQKQQQQTEKKSDDTNTNKSNKTSVFHALKLLQKSPSLRSIILIKFLCALGLSTFHSTFMILTRRYGLSAQENGMVLSFVGGLTIFVNTFVIAYVTNRYSDSRIVKVSLVSLIISFACVSLATNSKLLLFLVLPITLGGSISATILTSLLTKTISVGETGTVLGLDMAVGSFSRVISPVLGGYVLDYWGQTVLGLFVSVCALGAALLAITQFKWPVSSLTVKSTRNTDLSTTLKREL